MARTRKNKGRHNADRQTKRSWRLTRIRFWRKHAGLSRSEVAEHLAKLGLKPTTHTSVGRIETGVQKPSIDAIEAMASRFGTDVHSMLNRLPAEAEDLLKFEALEPSERHRLLEMWELMNRQGDEDASARNVPIEH